MAHVQHGMSNQLERARPGRHVGDSRGAGARRGCCLEAGPGEVATDRGLRRDGRRVGARAVAWRRRASARRSACERVAEVSRRASVPNDGAAHGRAAARAPMPMSAGSTWRNVRCRRGGAGPFGTGASQGFMTACRPSSGPNAHLQGLVIVRQPRKFNARLTGATCLQQAHVTG